MSALNDAIKNVLLTNGFEQVNDMPDNVGFGNKWDYIYFNGEFYIFFDNHYNVIAARCATGHMHELYSADADGVIAYFTEHGKAPKQATINTAPDTAVSNEGRTMSPLEHEQYGRDLNNAIQAANCTELNRSNIFKAIKSSAFDGAVAFYQPHLLTLIDENGQLIITVNLNNPHWLQHIELVTGKLTVPNAVAQKLLLG
jgi:hypothetical protein